MIISFANHNVTLLPEKAIWIDAVKLLCVADLHLEKDSFFAVRSTFVPPYGSLETLQKLQKLVGELTPDIVVAAGDSFHDKGAVGRMKANAVVDLNLTVKSVRQWHWLSGNHDPSLGDVIAGFRCADLTVGGISFRHQATSGADAEVSGHYHPKIRLNIHGHRLSAPCFVQHRNRLFLPSFGQYTGGLDIDSDEFLQIVPREERKTFIAYENEIFLQK